jgi:electron transfer flavoprotein alpha subunit
MSGILVITEQTGGAWHKISFEALGAAMELGAALGVAVRACVFGSSVGALAGELACYTVEKVIALESPLLASYTADGAAQALEGLVRAEQPDYVVLPHTYQVRDYASRLATRLGRALLADATGLRVEEGAAVFERQLFQGKLTGDFVFETPGPNFVSVQAGSFRAPAAGAGGAEVETRVAEVDAARIRQKAEAPFREAGGRAVDLGAAERIVAVGRGIREEGNLPLIEELAVALGAEVGASRPICDNGWLGMERQVGSSGQTVAPKLYVAVGISGAIQHLVGMKGSGCIVAINKDAEAPVFEVADYGVVGDLFEVVPALTEVLTKTRG